MTLVSSGNQILLKGTSDTNPTSTVSNELYSQTMTTGLDALLSMSQLVETGDGQFTPTVTWQGDVYGFNSTASNFSGSYVHGKWDMNAILAAGENRRYTSTSAYGSLGSTTYTDNSSITRTIRILTWGVPDGSPSPNTNDRVFCFALSGTSVTNSDNTFQKLEITTNGGTTVTINRTDLVYDSNEAGNSWWQWNGTSASSTMYNNVGSLGTPSASTSYTVKIISGTTTTTLNTGISEEMSGGTDTDPIEFSDYYKDGIYHATTGIPTSGEIKFSDFYGKTRAQAVTAIMSATMTNGHDSGQYHYSNGFSGTSSIGSASGTSLSGTVGGQTGCIMSTLLNTNGILYFQYIKSGFSGSFTNTGWTTLKVYLGQNNNSGTADLTLARTAFSFSSSNGIAYYSYNGSSPSIGSASSTASGAIFGASGGTHFIEIV